MALAAVLNVAAEPQPVLYEIVEAPAVTVVATPVVGFMVTLAVELLVHTPPETVSVKVNV
jgi:hypothetical protein